MPNEGVVDFVIIDVETANPDLTSICQIGVAVFSDGQFHESWSSFVNPQDYFSPINTGIHGIKEEMVINSPSWKEVHDILSNKYSNQILASHTPFDRTAIHRACEKNSIVPLECNWIDTARVVRRTWPVFSQSGYGLANVAAHFGIKFKHHDAEEDARATGEILIRAINESGSNASDWCSILAKPSKSSNSFKISSPSEIKSDDTDGALFGNVVVFTGALSIPRQAAANAASAAGCEVAATVNKHTSLLVVGDQDIRRLAGADKSTKHRKAEELIAKGQKIRIIGESDFTRLINS